jgi:hypothetical protein
MLPVQRKRHGLLMCLLLVGQEGIIFAQALEFSNSTSAPGAEQQFNSVSDNVMEKARRLQILNVGLSLIKPMRSNIEDVPKNQINVDAFAGMSYSQLVIHADGGLAQTATARVKLARGDATTELHCQSKQVTAAMPLDGQGVPAAPTPTRNVFEEASFPRAGIFKLCYSFTGQDADYILFPMTITVRGADSTAGKFWCQASTAIPCQLKITGTALQPGWKLSLVNHDGVCKKAPLMDAFEHKVSIVGDAGAFHVHDLGKKPDTNLATYTVCYCPGFDANNANGACHSGSKADFVQTAGRLFITNVQTSVKHVYPTLKFDFTINCGANVGGCAANTKVRYKIVEDHIDNDRPYWDEGAGCRKYFETRRQLNPVNCISKSNCEHSPESANPLQPKWKNIQMDTITENNIIVASIYDVCYCDEECEDAANWFKVGEFQVKPMTVNLEIGGVALDPPVMNTGSNIVFRGVGGGWTPANDDKSEMKVFEVHNLADESGCATKSQSTQLLEGHECIELNDCTSPSETVIAGNGDKNAQIFGQDDIKIKKPGWVAVCYCDQNCAEGAANWRIAGRLLVAGPMGMQSWSYNTHVTFKIGIQGYSLSTRNRLLIAQGSKICGKRSTRKSENVIGPVGTGDDVNKGSPELKGEDAGSIAGFSDLGGGQATMVEFKGPHHLSTGDYVKFKGVTGGTEEQNFMFNRAHRIESDPSEPKKLKIPLKFDTADFPNIEHDKVSWVRNSLATFTLVKALAAGTYKVCWSSAFDTGDEREYVAEAGSLQITDPTVMPAKLGLTTIEIGVAAPIVISFHTSKKNAYVAAEESMQLKVLFMDDSVLQPLSQSKSDIVVGVADNIGEARQNACGEIFLEFWSSDPEYGFPMPKGCYYNQDTVNPAKPQWQFYMLFDKKNGLKGGINYQIVMHAKAKTGLSPENPKPGAVQVWAMDDIVHREFDVVEMGRAHPIRAVAIGSRENGDPAFHAEDGFKIEGGSFSLLNLKGEAVVPIGIRSSSTGYIKPGHVMRIFLFPLTQWALGESCKARLTDSNGRLGANVNCFPEMAGPPAAENGDIQTNRNIVRLTFPAEVGQIKETAHQKVQLQKLPVPTGGFFPRRWAAELQCKADCTKAHYTESQGDLVFVEPKFTVAAVVSKPGNGNTKPFKGDTENILFLKLVSGAKIFSELAMDSHFSISPPKGYTCLSGEAAPEDLGIFKDKVPSTNGKLGGDPVYEGYWDMRVEDGKSRCIYHFMKNAVLYPNVVVFVQLKVNNPPFALLKTTGCDERSTEPREVDYRGCQSMTRSGRHCKEWTDYHVFLYGEDKGLGPGHNMCRNPKPYDRTGIWCYTTDVAKSWDYCDPVDDENNRWSAAIRSKGEFWKHVDSATKIFQGEKDLFGNLSVLGKLMAEVIIPSNFAKGAYHFLYVFFKTQQSAGEGAEVWVEAPLGFEFGSECNVQSLEKEYYMKDPEYPTQPLITERGSMACLGEKQNPETSTTMDRARIQMTGHLLGNTYYGFKLYVKNPEAYSPLQKNGWRIWTYTHNAVAAVDGSYTSVRLNPHDEPTAEDPSWGIYNANVLPGNFEVSIKDMRPSGRPTPIDVRMIVTETMGVDVRIVAPMGYVWDYEPEAFKYRQRAPGVPDSEVLPDVGADLPLAFIPPKPAKEPRNVLLLMGLDGVFNAGIRYGFRTTIVVPQMTPTVSANIFTIEYGFNQHNMQGRMAAGVIPAFPVSKLVNVGVDYTSSLQGANNMLTFSLQVNRYIPRDGALLIIGPPKFRLEERCNPEAAPGFQEFPDKSACSVRYTTDDRPIIAIKQNEYGINAAMYRFRLQAWNPVVPIENGKEGSWAFHTFSYIEESSYMSIAGKESGRSLSEVEAIRLGRSLTGAEERRLAKIEVLEYVSASSAFPINGPMKMADIVHAYKCDYKQNPSCSTKDQQYEKTGRVDTPDSPNQLIFTFILTNAGRVNRLKIKGPPGYVFPVHCHVRTSAEDIFGEDLQPDFSVYTRWPDDVKTSDCRGNENVATLRITHGLAANKQYLFRINLLHNPFVTPPENSWVIEYNGESSNPFWGFNVWAFTSFSAMPIRPRDTSVSMADAPTTNVVTISLKPFNEIAKGGGELHIEGPEGFVLPTNCQLTITTVDEQDATDRYRAITNDYTCKGTLPPSSKSIITFVRKSLKPRKQYILELLVLNPKEVAETAGWKFKSFMPNARAYSKSSPMSQDEGMYELDSSTLAGFPTNAKAELFILDVPSLQNGQVPVTLSFTMQFAHDVVSFWVQKQYVQIMAPEGFDFQERIPYPECNNYQLLRGNFQSDIECDGRTIRWENFKFAERVLVLKGQMVRFSIDTVNPFQTPDLNIFSLQHGVIDEAMLLSSRNIDGYEVFPQLNKAAVSVKKCNADKTRDVCSTKCMPDTSDLKIGWSCQAVASRTSILLEVTPQSDANLIRVEGEVRKKVDGFEVYDHFNFKDAKLDSGAPVKLADGEAKTEYYITLKVSLRSFDKMTFSIYNIKMPSVSGTSHFHITTYNDLPIPDNRADESPSVEAFPVLRSVSVLLTSEVLPDVYKVDDATISIWFKTTEKIERGEYLALTPPPGYVIKEGSFVTQLGVQGEDGGKSVVRLKPNGDEGFVYFVKLKSPIPPALEVAFDLTAALPAQPMHETNWFIDTLNMPEPPTTDPHPDEEPTGTNDGVFAGFSLVDRIPFSVNMGTYIPGADTTATVDAKLPRSVQAKKTIRIDLQAPVGFVFNKDCMEILDARFSKCAGTGNKAMILTNTDVLDTGFAVQMFVTNPKATPQVKHNNWLAKVYLDDSQKNINFEEVINPFRLEAMNADFTTCNQRGIRCPGFFRFKGKKAVMVGGKIEIYAPKKAGYKANCYKLHVIGLPSQPKCIKGNPLILLMEYSSLLPGRDYSFGIGVTMPDEDAVVNPADNVWGLALKSKEGRILDANMEIPGIEPLVQCGIKVGEMSWQSKGKACAGAEDRKTCGHQCKKCPGKETMDVMVPEVMENEKLKFHIGFTVKQTKWPGELAKIQVTAPRGVSFGGHALLGKISGGINGISHNFAGEESASEDFECFNAGQYDLTTSECNITIEARVEAGNKGIWLVLDNPTKLPVNPPNNNTWHINMFTHSGELILRHTLPGYEYGDESPGKYGINPLAGGAFLAKWGGCSMLSLFVSLAWTWL